MAEELGAVLFDMDGVLIDSARVADRLLVSAAESHGVVLTPSDLARLNGASGVQFWSDIMATHELPGSVDDYLETYDSAAEVAAYTPELLAPGINEFVGDLQDQGIAVGVVTSASCWRTQSVVRLLNLDEPFSTVVCGDEVLKHKPSPEPYLMAADRLSLASSACLAIEDSKRGAESALAAGMSLAGFVGFDDAVRSIPDFHELIEDFRTESSTSIRDMHRSAWSRGRRLAD